MLKTACTAVMFTEYAETLVHIFDTQSSPHCEILQLCNRIQKLSAKECDNIIKEWHVSFSLCYQLLVI